MTTRGKIFASTLIDLSIAMAENGWHEEALNLLRSTDQAKVLTLRKGWSSDSSRLLAHYVEKEDNKLFAILGSNITSTIPLLIFLEFNLDTALSPAFLPIFEALFIFNNTPIFPILFSNGA